MENIGTLIVVMVETGPFSARKRRKTHTLTFRHSTIKGKKQQNRKIKHSRLEVLGTVDHHFGSGK